ncbi:pentatricopeptide repeat-containing protein At2g02980, chloroplastic-like [Nymphaea colorata]|uniref:DYW domain-containing protein n=1 Tax=Nymphaea colorata TaxID=210225 RepID=A0A5K1AIX9_9MAGN|nr:pentatricopeptide repeat-containing protein At2g02980, chloroplastic-like [Nymphaea colorata]
MVDTITATSFAVHLVYPPLHLSKESPTLVSPSSSRWPHVRPLPISLVQECKNLNHIKQVHTRIIKENHAHTDVLLVKLVEHLVNLSYVHYAREVFDRIPEPTPFLFNTIIRGYASSDAGQEGMRLFLQMQERGVLPDNFTYPFLLKSCGGIFEGREVHAHIFKYENLASDVFAQTSLVSFYANNGDLEAARIVFDKMPNRNTVSWTAMITGYVQQQRFNEGLALFHEMLVSGIEPNEFTLVNVLSACAHLGGLELGRWVHEYIGRNEICINQAIGTALIDMYMKCGCIQEAADVFKDMSDRSVFTWNSMIGGLAMHGHGDEALDLFWKMQECDVIPDNVTFVGVLSACNHAGLVEKGKELFHSMNHKYGVVPNIKHYGCLVDLLGRAGHVDEAYEIAKGIPLAPSGILWGSLLNACYIHKRVSLAEGVMEKLMELDPYNGGNYVLMSNIYAAAGMWEDAAKVRKFMKDRGIQKTPGCSSIEVDNMVHDFMVGDGTHPRSKDIYLMLDEVAARLKAEGYVPKTSLVVHDIDDEGKMNALCHHSEKLAIAFGLISTGPNTPIRVVKNLRACDDCHLATKLISKIYNREIIVRDRNRFHHFKDGVCSCGDYW